MTTVAELAMIPAHILARLGLHRAGVTTAAVRDELAAIRTDDPELADSIADQLALCSLALIRAGHERPAELAADTLAVIDPEVWVSLNATWTGTTPRPSRAHRPRWHVGPIERACDQCLGETLRHVRATSDGFSPVLVLPLGSKRS